MKILLLKIEILLLPKAFLKIILVRPRGPPLTTPDACCWPNNFGAIPGVPQPRELIGILIFLHLEFLKDLPFMKPDIYNLERENKIKYNYS